MWFRFSSPSTPMVRNIGGPRQQDVSLANAHAIVVDGGGDIGVEQLGGNFVGVKLQSAKIVRFGIGPEGAAQGRHPGSARVLDRIALDIREMVKS